MIPFNRDYLNLLNIRQGLENVLLEMERQNEDLRATAQSAGDSIAALSNAIVDKRDILLLGMGASHFVNHMAAMQLRELGYKAVAIPASEFFYNSFDVKGQVVILTSQSGESVETVKCLEKVKDSDPFSITLDGESTLGRKCRAIIASGGKEQAFAGTRSVTLTLGIFSLVMEQLGLEQGATLAALNDIGMPERLYAAINSVSHKKNLIATGRGIFYGLAELFRLGCEELSGIPTLCYETGQLRHGPLEVLDESMTLIIFRQSGVFGNLAVSLEDVATKSGASLIVFDASGSTPLRDSITIPFPAGNSLASALQVLPYLQSFMISYACKRNPQAGTPLYSTKVTITE